MNGSFRGLDSARHSYKFSLMFSDRQAADTLRFTIQLRTEKKEAGRRLLGRREILIVEDNPGDVRLMKEALKVLEPPVNVHVASDGDQAIQFLRQEGEYAAVPTPNLIFLDFNLPRSGSCDLLHQIKQDRSLTCIPVAVLTTSDVDRDIRRAYELHANCYVRKPSDLDGFFSTIRTVAHFWLDVVLRPGDSGADGSK